MPAKAKEERAIHRQSAERREKAPAKETTRNTAPEQEFPDFTDHEVRTLLAWYAPGRPYKKRSKEFYMNSLLIVLALQVILFLFSQYLLMLVILSVAFLVFALSVTPPAHVYYRISTEGVTVEEHFYLWQELYDFYITDRMGIDMIHIRTKAYFPGELILLPGDTPINHIKEALMVFLPYREVVRKTFTEKAGNWLSDSFPLEKPSASHHASSSAHAKK